MMKAIFSALALITTFFSLQLLAQDYTITNNGNDLVITDVSGNGETIRFSQVGSNFRFSVTGRTYSLNGGPSTSFPYTFLPPARSITIHAGEGNDVIRADTFTLQMPNLTINGDAGDDLVLFTGNIDFALDANLDLILQNDVPVVGTDLVQLWGAAQIKFYDAGSLYVDISGGMTMMPGTSLQVENGNIQILCNTQLPSTVGSFTGLNMLGNSYIKVDGEGDVYIHGVAGAGSSSEGVFMSGFAKIISNATTDTIKIIGIGEIGVTASSIRTNGASVKIIGNSNFDTGHSNYGVACSSDSIIVGGNGFLFIEGKGGKGEGLNNYGVYINNFVGTTDGDIIIRGYGGGDSISSGNVGVTVTGIVSSFGNGKVDVMGWGGNTIGGGTNNEGIFVFNNGLITANNGELSVTGYAGGIDTSSINYGIYLKQNGRIVGTGTSIVRVVGYGGVGTNGKNYGIAIDGGPLTNKSCILGNNDSLIVTGYGGGTGNSGENVGIKIFNDGFISSTGSGAVVVNGTGGNTNGNQNYGIEIFKGYVSTGGGNLNISGYGGNAAGASNKNYGIHVLNGSYISAGGSGLVSVQGVGGSAKGRENYGVYLYGTNSGIKSTSGNIIVNGTGGGTDTSRFNYGVYIKKNAVISQTGSGTLLVNGVGGNSSGVRNVGVALDSSGQIYSSNGDITINGTGGSNTSSSQNYGIYINFFGKIIAANNSNIAINATGGNTSICPNTGFLAVAIPDSTVISAQNGNISIDAYSGNCGGGTSVLGFELGSGKITSTGSGNITINGYSGYGTPFGTYGIGISNARIETAQGDIVLNGYSDVAGSSAGNRGGIALDNSSKIIANANGNITLVGEGNGSTTGFCIGVGNFNNSEIKSTNGIISVTGTCGSSNLQSYGVASFNSKIESSGTGNIIVNGIAGLGPTSDNNKGIFLNSKSIFQSTDGNITLEGIGGGGTTTNNSIGVELSDSSIVRSIGIGNVVVFGRGANVAGSNNHGVQISGLSSSISRIQSNFGSIQVTGIKGALSSNARGVVLGSYGILESSSNNITIADSGGFVPQTSSTETFTDVSKTLKLDTASTLYIEINGTTPDAQYHQLNVQGKIDLNNAELLCTGSHSVSVGDVFTIVNNDGTDSVIGRFNGLAESDYLLNFLGSGYPAHITYKGGDGNDVVLTVVSAVPDYYIFNNSSNITVIDSAGNSDALTLSRPGLSLRINVPGRTYSLNGSPSTSFPYNFIPVTGSITINAKAGNDSVIVQTLIPTTMPHLTINGGRGNDVVLLNGNVTFASNAHLDLDLQDDDPLPDIDEIHVADNAIVTLSGTGKATFRASRKISLGVNAALTTQNGDITVEANKQLSPTTGDFVGFEIDGGKVEITDHGILQVYGRGGTLNPSQHGVYVHNGGKLLGGTIGTSIIDGIGGSSGGSNNYGIYVLDTLSLISSNGGNIELNGTGGGFGVSASDAGVVLRDKGKISAGGSGNLLINGNGSGTAEGANNHGIWAVSNAVINTNNGEITINGVGGGAGTSSSNIGLFLQNGSVVQPGGSKNVSITGYGGNTLGSNNIGVSIVGTNAIVSANGGAISIVANGGNGTSANHGMNILSEGAVVQNGNGIVQIEANGGNGSADQNNGIIISGANSKIESGDGDIVIFAQGGGTGASGRNSGLLLTSDGFIKNNGAGRVEIYAKGGAPNTFANHGVVTNNNCFISSNTGDVKITAIKGGGSSSVGHRALGYVRAHHANILLADTGGYYPLFSGIDDSTSSLKTVSVLPGSTINFEINGTTPNVSYSQLQVNGNVALNNTGITFFNSTYTPIVGDSFVIINNDGIDPVSGIFAGLAEGDQIVAFLGSAHNAQITYAGGDGNDVVLRVVASAFNIWLGFTTDWNEPTNWSYGTVPSMCVTDVMIPTAPIGGNFPIISSFTTVGCKNLVMQDNSRVRLGFEASLQVCRNFTGGSIDEAEIAGSGYLVFIGDSAQFIYQKARINYVTIDNIYGVSMASGSAWNIYHQLKLKGGDFNAGYRQVTFKSTDVSHCAIINDFEIGFIGNLHGIINAERYYEDASSPALHKQHYFSSPFNNLPFNQFAPLAGADNVAITPKPDCDEMYSASGSNYGNVFEYDEQLVTSCHLEGWKVRSAGNAQNGKGYSVVKIGNGTLSIFGEYNHANYTHSGLTNSGWTSMVTPQGNSYESGWHLLGNPYLASLDLDHSLNTDFDDEVLVLHTHGTFAGTYQPVSMMSADVLAPFQGFFARKSVVGGYADFTIEAKDRSAEPAIFHKQHPKRQMSLKVEGNGFADITYFNFNAQATNGFDADFDGGKFSSFLNQPTIYSIIGGTWASVNTNPDVASTQHIPVGFNAGSDGVFQITASGFDELVNTTVYLEDKKENVMHNLTQAPYYTFAAQKGDNNERFVLHFNQMVSSIGNEATSPISVNLFPNPASEMVYIEVKEAKRKNQEIKVELVDMNGKTVLSTTINNGKGINISQLAPAVYQLKITTENGTFVKRLVKE